MLREVLHLSHVRHSKTQIYSNMKSFVHIYTLWVLLNVGFQRAPTYLLYCYYCFIYKFINTYRAPRMETNKDNLKQ